MDPRTATEQPSPSIVTGTIADSNTAADQNTAVNPGAARNHVTSTNDSSPISCDKNVRYVIVAEDSSAHLTARRRNCIEPFFARTVYSKQNICVFFY